MRLEEKEARVPMIERKESAGGIILGSSRRRKRDNNEDVHVLIPVFI
jgi:hypothetical protein